MSDKTTGGRADRSSIELDQWPDFPCPWCENMVWVEGFDDAQSVRGQGEWRHVAHCGVCEFVVVGRDHHVG